MEEHLVRAQKYVDQTKLIVDFDPEYVQILMDNKETVLFQMQLVKNREIKLFGNTVNKVNELLDPQIAPIFGKYLGVSAAEAEKLWVLIKDSFYSKVTIKTYSQEWISAYAAELKGVIHQLRQPS